MCLDALRAQTYKDFEVILVDNDSGGTETEGMAARFPDLRLRRAVQEGNTGFAAGSNRGARLANGAWLAMLNPDAFPAPDWLQELVGAAATLPDAFFASRQIQANRPLLLDGEGDTYYTSGLAMRAHYNRPYSGAGSPREVFSACAAAAMYPREAFLAAGGFDADYFAYHEDVDLGFRLRLRGLRCFLVQKAVVRHVGAASSGRRSSVAVYHGHRNLVWTFAKDMPSPWIWLYLPLHLVANVASIVYFALAGHSRTILRAKCDALRGLPGALAKRRGVQAQRKVPASQVVQQMNHNVIGPLEGWTIRQQPMVKPR